MSGSGSRAMGRRRYPRQDGGIRRKALRFGSALAFAGRALAAVACYVRNVSGVDVLRLSRFADAFGGLRLRLIHPTRAATRDFAIANHRAVARKSEAHIAAWHLADNASGSLTQRELRVLYRQVYLLHVPCLASSSFMIAALPFSASTNSTPAPPTNKPILMYWLTK